MKLTRYFKVFKKNTLKPWVGIFAVGVILVTLYAIQDRSSQAQAEMVQVVRGTVEEGVMVTGKVTPAQAVDLSFERNGKVTNVTKKVGDRVEVNDTIISIDNREAAADLAQAKAALAFQQSKLDELEASAQPEQIELSKAKVVKAEATLEKTKVALATALQDAYLDAEDALYTKIDLMFTNSRTNNPQLVFESAVTTEMSLESGRVEVEARLRDMKAALPLIKPTEDLEDITKEFKTDLGETKLFLDNLSFVINALTANQSIPEAKLATWKADTSAARTSVTSAITAILTSESKMILAQEDFDLANKQLNFDMSGAAVRQLTAQRAQVAQAEANVAAAYAQFTKTTIKAPIDGIVTKLDVARGETVLANTVVVSVISDAQFEIEAHIPEADISQVHPGGVAQVTLDAYGAEEVFTARVVSVDPTETILNGTATYKTTFQFEGSDERIKSGMTANVRIEGQTKQQVLIIPQRALVTRNGQKFVMLKQDDVTKEVHVKTGIRGIDNMVEIIEGLEEGDTILIRN